MKKAILLPLMLILITNLSHAQDTLQRVDGSKQAVIILEVNPSQIRYIRANDPDSIVHVIATKAVASIIYDDGAIHSFEPVAKPNENIFRTFKEPAFKKNYLSANILDIAFNSLTIAYERIFEKGIFGVKVPISLGYGKLKPDKDYYSFYNGPKIYHTGLDINVYPFKQQDITFFVGLSGVYGLHKYYYGDKHSDDAIEKTTRFRGYSINVGASLNFSDKLAIYGLIGSGRGWSNGSHWNYDYLPRIPLEAGLRYMF